MKGASLWDEASAGLNKPKTPPTTIAAITHAIATSTSCRVLPRSVCWCILSPPIVHYPNFALAGRVGPGLPGQGRIFFMYPPPPSLRMRKKSPAPFSVAPTLKHGDELAMNFVPFSALFLANFRELRKAEVQLPRMPKRRSSQNSPSRACYELDQKRLRNAGNGKHGGTKPTVESAFLRDFRSSS